MAIRPSTCTHEDWPCCGCGEVSLRHPDYDGPMGIFTGYGEDDDSDDCENGECPECGETVPDNTQYGESCKKCGHVFDLPESRDDEPQDMTDVEADADTLRSCGWGTDEDYLPDTPLGDEYGG